MRKFTVNKFDSNYKATIGADFLARELTVGKKQVTLQLWDTAGQERYEVIICICIVSFYSFVNFRFLESWMCFL